VIHASGTTEIEAPKSLHTLCAQFSHVNAYSLAIQDEPEGWLCWVVNIRMVRAEEWSLKTIGLFVATSQEIQFEAQDRHQIYDWVEQVLVGQQYPQPGAGYATDRVLHGQRRVQLTVYRRRRFAQLYTRADIELLASVDEAHETLSGQATRRSRFTSSATTM
jgi:hypothetical protein